MQATEIAELYNEELAAATRRHFAAYLAEMAAEGDIVDVTDDAGTAFMWQMAEEAAEAELAERERAAVAEAHDDRISRVYARMYA